MTVRTRIAILLERMERPQAIDPKAGGLHYVLVRSVGRSAFAQLIERGLKSASEFFGWAGTPIVEEVNHRLSAGHVIMDRNHVQTVGTECFQNRCHLLRQHGDV